MTPLIGWRPLRAVVSLGLVVGAMGAFGFAFLFLLWLFKPMLFLGALLGLICAGPAAAAVWRGKGGRYAVPLVLMLLLAAAAVAVARAVEERQVRDLGVPTESYFELYAAAAGGVLLSAALLLAVAPRVVSARATTWASASVATFGMVGLGLAGTTHARTTCADSRLDAAVWREARGDDRVNAVTRDERIASAIVDCRLLHGRSRAEVERLLGPPDERYGRRLYWAAGWVNEGLGPGDGQELILTFRRGRVTDAGLSYDAE